MSNEYLINNYMNTRNYCRVHENDIILIQKHVRGYLFRLKRLPLVLYIIQNYLSKINYNFINLNEDGRTNSNFDEDKIIDILINKFKNKIKKPSIRNWFDVGIYDNYYGWLPVNIKSTTTKTSDNVGNLALCVYSYTNEYLNLNETYDNGLMANILFSKLKNNQLNKKHKKDYYFLVLNKNDNKDIIVNSVKGLSILTSNINNLPFQVKWDKNRIFNYKNINYCIQQFLDTIRKPKPSWKETFLINIRDNL